MHLPDNPTLKIFTKYYSIATIVFALIYGLLNYWTAQRTDTHRLFFDWERDIPFVPSFIYGYLSIMLIFLLPVFFLRARHFPPLCVAFISATLFAGLIYALLPAELAHQRPSVLPSPELLYGLLYSLALPHNLFPSLHITYSSLILLAVAQHEAPQWISIAAILWFALICVSVILVRQHQLLDIPSGMLVGWIAYRFIYLRRLSLL